ncbi:ABC transporter substrate-binding protein [Peptostreptococcaceae bacterium AGR-M142]
MKKLFSLLILLLLLFVFISCSKEEINIGFSSTLSGTTSELGVESRNAILMYIDKLNEDGGINGRQVNLVIKDDKGTNDGARKVIKEFKQEGVDIIIGFTTSNRVEVINEAIEDEKMLFMSPTISTTLLSKKDDYFFRVMSDLTSQGTTLSELASEDRNIKAMAVIYDGKNAAYSNAIAETFKADFEKKGGEIVYKYKIEEDIPMTNLISNSILDSHAKGILVIANSVDSAAIIQQIRKYDDESDIFIPGWAMTNDFINYGGKAVEGVYCSSVFEPESKTPRYLDFVKEYERIYHKKPSFSANFGYDSMIVLEDAISKKGTNIKAIKEQIIKTRIFNGLQGEFILDEYGDAQGKVFKFQIKDSMYKKIE